MAHRGPLDDPSATPAHLDRFVELGLAVIETRPLVRWSPSLFRIEVPALELKARIQLHDDADFVQLAVHETEADFRGWNRPLSDDSDISESPLWITWGTRAGAETSWRRAVIERRGTAERWTPHLRGRGGSVRGADFERGNAVLGALLSWKDDPRRVHRVDVGGRTLDVRIRPARDRRVRWPLSVPGPDTERFGDPLGLAFRDELLRAGKSDALAYFGNRFVRTAAGRPWTPDLFRELLASLGETWARIDRSRERTADSPWAGEPPIASLVPEIAVELARWLGATGRVPSRVASACAAAVALDVLAARARIAQSAPS